ncbi:hypothetical protein TONV_127 [Tipula oleracea nudivirus]|uniref:Uncharacterized protein n=1 Tax=Tipula oleracea nudivirus TaxID=1546257 RepID=A0A0B4VG35_9VIRU|nr:hypothetical protein TONV_127 [Tipula oleracea nudivirus]AJD20187.1 hypothetical protein TONV_127 [Tipula oleracea nudivirus]
MFINSLIFSIVLALIVVIVLIIYVIVLIYPMITYYGDSFLTYRNQYNIKTNFYKGSFFTISIVDSIKLMYYLWYSEQNI